MNRRQAEAVLALEREVSTALELLDSEAGLRDDWRTRYAAERVIERIFQAAEAITPAQQRAYFGPDALRYLRGMRNRLAHNDLAIDPEVLWATISVDLAVVRDRMRADAATAAALIERGIDQLQDVSEWRRVHLGPTRGTRG